MRLREWMVAGLLGTAALVVVARPGWAAGAPIEAATAEQKLEAQKVFLDAKKAFDAKRYDEALTGFRRSYDIVASPNSHHMVVRTLHALGRLVDAYVEAETTVAEAEEAAAKDRKYSRTAAAARAKRDELRGAIGVVTVSVDGADAESTVTVGGRELSTAEWGAPVPVMPGVVVVELSGPAGSAHKEIDVAAGAEVAVALAPGAAEAESTGPVPPPGGDDDDGGSGGLRIASYVVGGVGLVGFGMFAVAGAMHVSQYGDLRDRCSYAAICPPGVQADIDRGRTYQTIANVGVGIGAVGLAAGVAMFIASQPAVRFDARGTSTAPTLAIGPGAITVKGQF